MEQQPTGLYQITEILPMTTRRISLKTGKGDEFIFAPSLENIRAINLHIEKSYDGICYFCFSADDELYCFSGSDEESAELCRLFAEGDPLVQKAFATHYLRNKGTLVINRLMQNDQEI